MNKTKLLELFDRANSYILECDSVIKNFAFNYNIPRFQPKTQPKITPFQGLVEAIISQQLTSKAAILIYKKVLNSFACLNSHTLRPLDIIRVPDEELNNLGLSNNKIKAIKELASLFLSKPDLTYKNLSKLTEEQIIHLFTSIKGIGLWTVQMFMIFYLNRLDVLATTDYGLRKGAYYLYNLPNIPKPKELELLGEKWKPYRTIACWYLWRANEIFGVRCGKKVVK